MTHVDCCRNTATGDVGAAAKVDVDNVPSVYVAGVDGSGDSSLAAHGHQLPLVVRETEYPGWPCIAVAVEAQCEIRVSMLSHEFPQVLESGDIHQ